MQGRAALAAELVDLIENGEALAEAGETIIFQPKPRPTRKRWRLKVINSPSDSAPDRRS